MHCPQCRVDLGDLDPHWAPWCESCGWGIDPSPERDYESRFDRWWRRRLNAASAREHERLLRSGLDDGPSADRALVLLLCGIVHLVTLAVAVGIVLLLVSPVWLPFKVGLAVIGLALLFQLRPRLGKDEVRGLELSRETAPALWALVEEVATATGSRAPDRIELNSWVNASWGRVGLHKKRVLTLGFPLWAAIEGQQKIALLGHEVAHEVNGDVTRGLFVYSALQALDEWRSALTPAYSGFSRRSRSFLEMLMTIVLLPLVAVLLLVEYRLDELASRSHHYAEHRADAIGAELAGKEGALALERCMLDTSVLAFALRVPLRSDREADLWRTVQTHVASVPERERRRQLLLAERTLQSVDATHPATHRRLELVAAGPDAPARLVLSAEREAAVDAEIRAQEPWVRRRLLGKRET